MMRSTKLTWNNYLAGDKQTFTSLIKTFANSLYHYGLMLVGDEDFVKGCIGEVFLELWSKREEVKAMDEMKTYLLKKLRSKICQGKEECNFSFKFDIKATRNENRFGNESKLKLQELFQNLSQHQKEIVYLRLFEGLDQNCIARILGLHEPCSYSLTH